MVRLTVDMTIYEYRKFQKYILNQLVEQNKINTEKLEEGVYE
jgi:hypothetical protein